MPSPAKKKLRRAPESPLGAPLSLGGPVRNVDWTKCVLCVSIGKGPFKCPANNSCPETKNAGYRTMADMLTEFKLLGHLPSYVPFESMDEGEGVFASLVKHNAKRHVSCGLKYNRTALTRLKTRLNKEGKQQDAQSFPSSPAAGSSRITRSVETPLHVKLGDLRCFDCGGASSWNDPLFRISSLNVEAQIAEGAERHPDILKRAQLKALLSEGAISQERRYHKRCISKLVYAVRTQRDDSDLPVSSERICEGVAFAELVEYIRGVIASKNKDEIYFFSMGSLTRMYADRLAQLMGVDKSEISEIHSTRLRKRILSQMPELRAERPGNEYRLVPEETFVSNNNREDFDADILAFNRVIKALRNDIDNFKIKFTGQFDENCQENSVPASLLASISRLLYGSKAPLESRCTLPVLTVSQLVVFNFQKKTPHGTIIRHSKSREPPLPMYIGISVWGRSRSREQIDQLHALGVSVTSTRVREITSTLCHLTVNRAQEEGFLCPADLRLNLFTVGAYDNIDHNPSSTTSVGSFHGTGMSVFQMMAPENLGTPRSCGSSYADITLSSKGVPDLPESYGVVKAILLPTKKPRHPLMSVSSESAESVIQQHNFLKVWESERPWLEHVHSHLKDSDDAEENLSWAAYHASHIVSNERNVPAVNTLLPLFYEESSSPSMIRHGMDVVREITKLVNPTQTPVICMDQPLFTLAKIVQWNWPHIYGEDKYVVLFAPFHIEQAFLRIIGDVLEGCGWDSLLVSSGIASHTRAQNYLKVTHVTRSRGAHQTTASALYLLLNDAFSTSTDGLDFQAWTEEKCRESDMFYFWFVVFNLQILLLRFVSAIRRGNYENFLKSLQFMITWFFALDRQNYARWLSVHLMDLTQLPNTAPDVHAEFLRGNFVVKKTSAPFSALAIDQAHEQNNAVVKGTGGAVGLTEDPDALRRWMLTGPEVNRLLNEFENACNQKDNSQVHSHHEQYSSFQIKFTEKVVKLKEKFEEVGNPFLGGELFNIDSRIIVGESGVSSLRSMHEAGLLQYRTFVQQRLSSGQKTVFDPLKKNKFHIFKLRKTSERHTVTTKNLQSDISLFSKLYIMSKHRELDLQTFFKYENQNFPPSLSTETGELYHVEKSELLPILESLSSSQQSTPEAVNTLVFDGAALVHLIQPRLSKTYEEYWHRELKKNIEAKVENFHVQRVDIVWDQYFQNSLKQAIRQERGCGVRREVSACSPVPKNWSEFLLNDSNKRHLFKMLAEFAVRDASQYLVVTNIESTFASSERPDDCPRSSLHGKTCHDQEEADSRMMLHIKDAVQHGARSVLIYTVDTDVVVIAVSFFFVFAKQGLKELWILFGKGSKQRYISCHEIAESLGEDKATALRGFHAFTGSDLTSGFKTKGKRSQWKVWKSFEECTSAFLQLSHPNFSLTQEIFELLQKFVIVLYGGDFSVTSTTDEARLVLYTSKGIKNLAHIPPTANALLQHILRVAYQAGQIWGQGDNVDALILSPDGWGWVLSNGKWKPVWSTDPPVWEACRKYLIKCSCKTNCTKSCSCRRAGLPCTLYCYCKGNCFPSAPSVAVPVETHACSSSESNPDEPDSVQCGSSFQNSDSD